jgi:hypothetical protein
MQFMWTAMVGDLTVATDQSAAPGLFAEVGVAAASSEVAMWEWTKGSHERPGLQGLCGERC